MSKNWSYGRYHVGFLVASGIHCMGTLEGVFNLCLGSNAVSLNSYLF
jgi:hypothetical protein